MAQASSRLTVRATRTVPRSTTVTVRGEIDIVTAPVLSSTLLAVVAIPGGGHTDVDLNAVSFFGACGIRVLIAAREHAATADTTLGTRAAADTAAGRVLDVVGWVHDPRSEPDAGRRAGPGLAVLPGGVDRGAAVTDREAEDRVRCVAPRT